MAATAACENRLIAFMRSSRLSTRAVCAAAPAKQMPRREGRGKSTLAIGVELQPVEDLVGPEALEPVQRLVERRELVGVDATDLFDGAHVFLIERLDDVAHFAALVGEPDAHRAAVDARALVVEEAHLDKLLEIVGDVGAEIVAARAQFAGGELLLPRN